MLIFNICKLLIINICDTFDNITEYCRALYLPAVP